jgi:hypothetical protein
LKRYDPPKTDADKTSSSFGHAVEDLCTEQKTDPAHAFHALVQVEIKYKDEESGDRGVVKLLVRCQLDAVLPSDPAATSRQDELVKLAGKCAKASVDKVYATREAKDPSFVEIRSAKEKNWVKQGGYDFCSGRNTSNRFAFILNTSLVQRGSSGHVVPVPHRWSFEDGNRHQR